MIRWATWLYRIFGVVILVSVLSVFLVGFTPVSLPDQTPDPIADSVEFAANGSSNLVSNPGGVVNETGELLAPPELNNTKLKTAVHEEINSARTERSLTSLMWDHELSEIAQYHSYDMAENEYYAHTSPDGESMEDRYNQFGYNCQVYTTENRYLTGAENINKVYWNTEIATYGRITNETELAKIVVNQWMESPGHRENILKPEWENEGIGMATADTEDGTVVYVTQNFC